MPIYDFRCRECGKVSEIFLRDAVIWRRPLIGKTITQFGEDVLWSKLDYLIIDLPQAQLKPHLL